MTKFVNLVKLSVGSESVESLQEWQNAYRLRFADGLPRHITRMWPKREAELLAGGSIYWVIKGEIQCRQKILSLQPVTGDAGIRRCAIALDRKIYRTQIAPRRPFQGWRYLKPEESPADLSENRANETPLPEALAKALSDIGIL